MDQKIIALFDSYTHGGMNRRAFLDRLSALAGGTAAATALLPLLENNYASAQTIAEGDPRLETATVAFPAATGTMSGYLAKPKGAAKLPAVIVIHENRGLNPHLRDVARRVALEGFVAYAADFLAPLGGTPDDEEKARQLIGQLKVPDTVANARAVFAGLAQRGDTTGKVGAVGFCWGGTIVNLLAVNEPALGAGVAYYGGQPKAEDVARIKAPLVLHYAGLDDRINAGISAFDAALKAAGVRHEIFRYEGVNHAFNNDTNAARYNAAAAQLAWTRTIAFLKANLA